VRASVRLLIKLRLLWFILIAALLLSGCVRYDVGITFADANHGEIVQHIRIGEPLTRFSESVTAAWLESLERKAKHLDGRTWYSADEELAIVIPFHNAKDLETKFNQFFQPQPKTGSHNVSNVADLAAPTTQFHLTTNNFVLWQRHRLTYDLDLRSLSLLSTDGNLLVDPGASLELEFSLNTPWGAQVLDASDTPTPVLRDNGRQLVWSLQPEAVNHLDVMFSVPDPLGIGVLVIVLLVTVGAWVKSWLLHQSRTAPPQPAG
jgi:hypothetical protein